MKKVQICFVFLTLIHISLGVSMNNSSKNKNSGMDQYGMISTSSQNNGTNHKPFGGNAIVVNGKLLNPHVHHHHKNVLNTNSTKSHTIINTIPRRIQTHTLHNTKFKENGNRELIKLKQKKIKLKLSTGRRKRIQDQIKTRKILQRISHIKKYINRIYSKPKNIYNKRIHPLNTYLKRTSYKQELKIRKTNLKRFKLLTRRARQIKSIYKRIGNPNKRASLKNEYNIILQRRKQIYRKIKDSTSILKRQKRILLLNQRKQMLLNKRRQLLRRQRYGGRFDSMSNDRTRRMREKRFLRRKLNSLLRNRKRINQLVKRYYARMRHLEI